MVRSTRMPIAVDWTPSVSEDDSDCASCGDIWSPNARGMGEGERALDPLLPLYEMSVWTARSRVRRRSGFCARWRTGDIMLMSASSTSALTWDGAYPACGRANDVHLVPAGTCESAGDNGRRSVSGVKGSCFARLMLSSEMIVRVTHKQASRGAFYTVRTPFGSVVLALKS